MIMTEREKGMTQRRCLYWPMIEVVLLYELCVTNIPSVEDRKRCWGLANELVYCSWVTLVLQPRRASKCIRVKVSDQASLISKSHWLIWVESQRIIFPSCLQSQLCWQSCSRKKTVECSLLPPSKLGLVEVGRRNKPNPGVCMSLVSKHSSRRANDPEGKLMPKRIFSSISETRWRVNLVLSAESLWEWDNHWLGTLRSLWSPLWATKGNKTVDSKAWVKWL